MKYKDYGEKYQAYQAKLCKQQGRHVRTVYPESVYRCTKCNLVHYLKRGLKGRDRWRCPNEDTPNDALLHGRAEQEYLGWNCARCGELQISEAQK